MSSNSLKNLKSKTASNIKEKERPSLKSAESLKMTRKSYDAVTVQGMVEAGVGESKGLDVDQYNEVVQSRNQY